MPDILLGALVFAKKDTTSYCGTVIESEPDRITILDEFADFDPIAQFNPMSMDEFKILN